VLHSFSFSNFYSFEAPARVDLVLNQRDRVVGWSRVAPSGTRLSTAMAVMGANGAGKTGLLKALPFLAWFVRDSFRLEPGAPIAFHPPAWSQEEPSVFAVTGEDGDGVRWMYQLSVQRAHVLSESLRRRGPAPGDRPRHVFTRQRQASGNYTIKQSGLGIGDAEAVKVRPNVSLVSWARQYGSELAMHLTDFLLCTNLNVMGRTPARGADLVTAAEFYQANEPVRLQMTSLLQGMDLGLTDVVMKRIEGEPLVDDPTPRWYPMGVHRGRTGVFELPMALESSGTQTTFLLLRQLLPVLQLGGYAFIDELESDLHPHMIEPLLRLFHDEETNPHGAQIIFTCHSAEVLRVLGRAQVTFVEKSDCVSTAYRGDAIEGLTSAHNLYAKYMSGALGAVPEI
tara:strand:- start:2597 stop:3787 length:1191 start_codon:yes stop_codon:yes gene_type:complete